MPHFIEACSNSESEGSPGPHRSLAIGDEQEKNPGSRVSARRPSISFPRFFPPPPSSDPTPLCQMTPPLPKHPSSPQDGTCAPGRARQSHVALRGAPDLLPRSRTPGLEGRRREIASQPYGTRSRPCNPLPSTGAASLARYPEAASARSGPLWKHHHTISHHRADRVERPHGRYDRTIVLDRGA